MWKINRLLLEICKYIIMAMMLVMTITTFVQVIMRYVFVAPLTWPDELGRYLLVWSCCLGSAYAMKDGLHVSLNYLKNKISGHGQNVFVILVHLALMSFFIVCSKEGYQYAAHQWGQTTAALRISMGIPILGVPIGFTIMFLLQVESFIKDLYGMETVGFKSDA